MREIKFRAPCGISDKYVYFTLCDLGTSNDSFGLSLDLYKAEQYIGLNDKNGKEIYEGDILQTDEIGGIGYCVYKLDGFIFTDNNGGWSAPCWEKCTIIGNIYFNPERLHDGT